MKKIIAVFLMFVLLAFSSSNVFAAAKIYMKDIKYTRSGSQDVFSIYSTNYKGFKITSLSNPDRIIVDLPNNLLYKKDPGTMMIKGYSVDSVRYSQFTKKITRVVFDVKENSKYKVEQKTGYLKFTFSPQQGTIKVGTTKPEIKTPDKVDATRPATTDRGDVDRPQPVSDTISYIPSADSDKILIMGGNHGGFTAVRHTDPDRIIIDIPDCRVPVNQQDISGTMNLIGNINYTQLDVKTARLTVNTIGQPQFNLVNEQNQLVITIDKPTYRNIRYNNINDAAQLSLQGTLLTEIVPSTTSEGSVDAASSETGGVKKLYSESIDPTGKKYTITFPTALADIGTGIIQVNDGLIDYLEVTNDLQNQTTSVTVNSKSERKYEVISDTNTKQTIVSILKPNTLNDKLVVIDAGHGGYDSGASYAGIKEKDLNLKIALLVNDILKSKGIKTYMTRSTDEFIPLYDRANIANDLNATLFLSIHHNAYNTSENGTETLYFPGDRSKKFARTIQDTLIKALGTRDIGIIERPKLVVLHATKMPAALAEIAYITNEGDRQKLLDDQFILKAASSLSEGVINFLAEMNK